MKASILAGALAVTVWAGTAAGQSQSSTSTTSTTTTVPSQQKQTVNDPDRRPPPVEPGSPTDTSTSVPSSTSTTTTQTTTTTPDYAQPAPTRPGYAAPEPVYVPEEKDKMRGVTVMAGGGVEGYTGDLAPQINPGPSWRVTAAVKPTKVLGVELGYSGAVNELKGNSVAIVGGRGADIVRNGVDAVATLGLSATPVQPYILGGFGVSRYSVKDELASLGFKSDTSERIPLGGGIRTHVGQLTADARFNYSVLVNENFATTVNPNSVAGVNSVNAGAYQGTLQVGATF